MAADAWGGSWGGSWALAWTRGGETAVIDAGRLPTYTKIDLEEYLTTGRLTKPAVAKVIARVVIEEALPKETLVERIRIELRSMGEHSDHTEVVNDAVVKARTVPAEVKARTKSSDADDEMMMMAFLFLI